MEASLMPPKSRRDTWYREPWLLLVAGGPAFVVCASIYTGYIAMHGADKVVAEDYYKQGLMINKDIQRDAKARELQLNAYINADLTNSKVRLQLSGKGNLPETIQLSLANAAKGSNSVSEVIRRLPLKQTAPGHYEGELKLMPKVGEDTVKLFHIKLETTDWRLTGDWFDPGQKPVQLNAAK
ncbi:MULTISPECIES: FixH family protein [Undibacterium]|uniref:FixH family protein n=1 Tax=Undibacterium umbellatum TaxID=2762300 RepID=A0ABR6ZB75_9BURK|nr:MULTISPECIES: FixH family protein [Undibacterium]MBC3908997.1 FixH family protein [Undibacterium umbellatum]MDP1976838.1 FixH family protein [Undibacterium sp.]